MTYTKAIPFDKPIPKQYMPIRCKSLTIARYLVSVCHLKYPLQHNTYTYKLICVLIIVLAWPGSLLAVTHICLMPNTHTYMHMFNSLLGLVGSLLAVTHVSLMHYVRTLLLALCGSLLAVTHVVLMHMNGGKPRQ